MTPQPPPCQHCGRARLMTGLCPHCEHVYCVLCANFMSIIEYADHIWCHRFSYQYQERKSRLLFWWEVTKSFPARCPECEAILTQDGLCPKAVEAFNSGQGVRVQDLRLLGIGPGWKAIQF